MPEKNTLEQTFDGHREGHSSLSTDQWRERLESFLLIQDDVQGPLRVTNIRRPASGLSAFNIIFTIEYESSKATYVARVVPEKSFFVRHNIADQFAAHRYLNSIGLKVPNARWIDLEGFSLGRAGFIMDFWPGEASSTSYFTEGPIFRANKEQRVEMIRNMVTTIAELHNKADPFAIPSLVEKGRGENYLEREINHWYDLAIDAHPNLAAFYDPVRKWFVSNAPAVTTPVLVHGDFNASNILWDQGQVAAILDFESTRIGARESDVVYQYTIDVIASTFFTTGVNVPTLAERAAWYKAASRVDLENLAYHEARVTFQLSCAAVAIARYDERDMAVDPTPFMDFLNRRLLSMGMLELRLPTTGSSK